MDFAIPQDLEDYYAELEGFIDSTIAPLVARDDNIRFLRGRASAAHHGRGLAGTFYKKLKTRE